MNVTNTNSLRLWILICSILLINFSSAHTEKCQFSECILTPVYEDAFVYVPPPTHIFAKKNTATIDVTYDNAFPNDARAAFDYAVAIWEGLITSDITITVDASWVSLDQNVLGAAGPTLIYANFPNAPMQNTWYPSALAEKVSGSDLSTSQNPFDIEANFNSNFSSFYFGTDGDVPSGRFDFVTVVLHELGHGLGFIGSMIVENGIGSWGVTPGGQTQPLAYIYDLFVENGNGDLLIDTYPNNSSALASQLTGNDLFFNGVSAVSANSGSPVAIYAPSIWNTGSSYAHLDRNVFPAGDPNSLMEPSIQAAEAIHSPGLITLGVLEDIGWTVSDSVPPPPPPPSTFSIEQTGPNPFPTPGNSSFSLDYTLEEPALVTVDIYNILGQRVTQLVNLNQEAGTTFRVSWDGANAAGEDMTSGVYVLRFRAGTETEDFKVWLIR